jgi:hypothetical protein
MVLNTPSFGAEALIAALAGIRLPQSV